MCTVNNVFLRCAAETFSPGKGGAFPAVRQRECAATGLGGRKLGGSLVL